MIKITDTELVEQVCRQQIEGMLTKNISLLDRIISPDAIFVHLTGEQQSKSDWLQQIKKGQMKYFSSKELVLVITINDGGAHVEMKNLIEARIYGFRNTWSLAAAIDLIKVRDQWFILRSQASLF